MGWTDAMGQYHPEDEAQPPGLLALAQPSSMSNPNAQLAGQMLPASQIIPGDVTQQLRDQAAAQVASERPQLAAMDTGPQSLIMPPSPAPQMPGVRKDGLVIAGQSSQTSRQQTKFTPEYKAALANQDAIGDDARGALDQRAEVEGQRAQVNAERLQQQAEIEQQEEQRRAAVEQERGEAIKQAELAWQSKVDKASKFEFKSLWSQKSSGQRGLTMLGMALGAIGAAHTARAGGNPGENPALKVWQREEELDYQKQRDSLSQLKDDALMARTGIADAREARSAAMASLEIRRAARLRQAQLAFDSRAAELGTDAAKADAMAAKAELDMKLNAAKMNALEPANVKINQVTQTQLERPQMAGGAQMQGAMQAEAKNFHATHGKEIDAISKYTAGFTENAALAQQLREAAKTGNAALVQQVVVRIGTAANDGRLTDSDGKRLLDSVGSYGQQVKDLVAGKFKGELSKQTVNQLLKSLESNRDSNLRVAASQRGELMERAGKLYSPQVIEAVVPNPGEVAKRVNPSMQQQSAPQGISAADMEGARAFIAANPQDPRAQKLKQRLGI